MDIYTAHRTWPAIPDWPGSRPAGYLIKTACSKKSRNVFHEAAGKGPRQDTDEVLFILVRVTPGGCSDIILSRPNGQDLPKTQEVVW